MRALLLAATAAAALAVAAPAHAQVVHDPIHTATAVAQWVRQAERDISALRQLEREYAALTGPRVVNNLGRNLMSGLSRAPSSSASRMPGLGRGDELSEDAADLEAASRQYDSPETDWEAEEMRRRRRANANFAAEARRGMQAAEERRIGLEELVANVEAQPDLQAVGTLQNRLAAENLFMQNERDNLARIAVMQRTQERVEVQRDREKARQDADQWFERTRGAWDVQW